MLQLPCLKMKTLRPRVFRKNYKGHMDKTKWGWNQGRQVGMAGVGAERLGKGRKLHLNNKVFKKRKQCTKLNARGLITENADYCTTIL